ncbi:MAG: heavy metal-associated domain-containing protein [Chloroflexales bacterium]
MTLEILLVDGMRSEADQRAILAVVQALPGVRRATASLADRTLRVEREEAVGLAAIIAAIQGVGYRAAALA